MIVGTVKVPQDRIGAIIGRNGDTKKLLESKAGVKLSIDSEIGDIKVTQKGDAIMAHQTLSVLQAIGRGFSPSKAELLFNTDFYLNVISLKEHAKPGSKRMAEIRARLIGTSGKTRRIIEEITSTYVSVYGDTVSIIGDYVSLDYATNAVMMIVSGRKHRTVYQYLERSSHELKFRRVEEGF